MKQYTIVTIMNAIKAASPILVITIHGDTFVVTPVTIREFYLFGKMRNGDMVQIHVSMIEEVKNHGPATNP